MSERIRILHILTSLAPGGAETNLLALLRHFDRERFEHIVAFGGGGLLEEEFAERDVVLVRLSQQSLSLWGLSGLRGILKQIANHTPDIIHSHLDLPNVFALIAKRLLGCRLVLHMHGLGVIPAETMPGRGIAQRLWNMIAHLYRYGDRVIAICTFQIPYLEKLGVKHNQIALVPNGINIEGYPKASGKVENHYQFVNVARFFPQKDHELLINAFSAVAKEIPHARLALVGDGPLLASAKLLVDSLGLKNNIIFMGLRRDVPDVLAASHCSVLSSRWELHPISILEAMRAGLPVIATEVGGVADTVEDGVTGLLVKSRDQTRLTEAMRTLASDPERSHVMGANGYQRVKEHFSNYLTAKKIEAVYMDVMEGR